MRIFDSGSSNWVRPTVPAGSQVVGADDRPSDLLERNTPIERAVHRKRVPMDGRILAALSEEARAKGRPLTQAESDAVRERFKAQPEPGMHWGTNMERPVLDVKYIRLQPLNPALFAALSKAAAKKGMPLSPDEEKEIYREHDLARFTEQVMEDTGRAPTKAEKESFEDAFERAFKSGEYQPLKEK